MGIHIFALLSESYIQKNSLKKITRKITFRIMIFRKTIFIFLAQESYTRRSSYTRISSYTKRLIVIQGDERRFSKL